MVRGFGRKLDFLQRIEVEILVRRDVGGVRLVEAGGQEERLILVLLQQLDRFEGDFAVGVLLVLAHLVVEKTHGGAETAPGRVVYDVRLEHRLVPAGRVDEMVPRRRIIEPAGADVAGVAVVIDFPDASGIIAVVLEHLRQRNHVRHAGAEVVSQIEDTGLTGAQTGQK